MYQPAFLLGVALALEASAHKKSGVLMVVPLTVLACKRARPLMPAVVPSAWAPFLASYKT